MIALATVKREHTKTGTRLQFEITVESVRHRVGATVLPDNFGSIRVLEKLGFQHEGIRRQAYSLRGPYEDLLCYSILAPEWRELNR